MTNNVDRATNLLANSEFEGRTLHPAQARAIVHSLNDAGCLRADGIQRGKYRNENGAELNVLKPYGIGQRTSFGDIWVAELVDTLLGNTLMVVTPHSLRDCGFELIEPAMETIE